MSFNRQILQQKSGPTQLARQVTNVSGDYVMRADDDVCIEQAAGHIVSLPPIPALGDVHQVIAEGGALTLSGNGFLINGAANIGLVTSDQASLTFNGTGWDATITNPNPSGGGGGQANVILANGLNSNVATLGQAVVRVGGPTAAYSIDGFMLPIPPQGGDRFVLVNTVNFPLTVINQGTGSTAGGRINTLRQGAGGTTAGQVTLPNAGSSCAFVYDSSANNWVLEHIGTVQRQVFNVFDFGAVGDGVADDTNAIQAAVTAASGSAFGVVYFPPGMYLLTSTVTISSAITLRGFGKPSGGGGATGASTLSVLLHNFHGSCLHFSGANGTAVCQGGGVEDLRIFQKSALGGTAGAAILIDCTDDNHRPGYMRLRGLVIDEGIGADPWLWAIQVDGTLATLTPGITNMFFSEIDTHTNNAATGAVFLNGCEAQIFDCHHSQQGNYKIDGTAGVPSASVALIDVGLNAITLGWAVDFTMMGGIVSGAVTTTVGETTGACNIIPGRWGAGASIVDGAGGGVLGVLRYDPTVQGNIAGSYRFSKPPVLANNQLFMSIDAAGTGSQIIAFVDGSNITRLGQTGVVGLGNNPGPGGASGDLVVTHTNSIRFTNLSGPTGVRFIGIGAADQMILGQDAVDIQWGKALVAPGGGTTIPLFNAAGIGGAGPATAAQNGWMRVLDSTGAAFWVPCWK